MGVAASSIPVEHDAPIATWFGIGGRAERLARPRTGEELSACLEMDPSLVVLGDGANLLVDDDGISTLVVKLEGPTWEHVEIDRATGRVHAGAGANLPRLINETVREGLAGLEGLTGIPATVGGATIMNAGGRFGEIGSVIRRVHTLGRDGRRHELEASEIAFGYRRSGLHDHVVTAVELQLTQDDPAGVRERLKANMAYKKQSQPMAAQSAGCCFKNPTLEHDVPGIGHRGQRVSAGLLIDRAGCKGLAHGGASVSDVHANFFVTAKDAKARHVIELMQMVVQRVEAVFGVRLEREVVVWSNHP